MASCITKLFLLLLCTIASNVQGNTENTTEAKIPDQKENKPSNESQTQAPNNEVHVTNSTGQENHTTISASDHQKNTTEEQVHEERNTTDVGNNQNQTAVNETTEDSLANNTWRPEFRRYIHYLRNDTPVIEKLADSGKEWKVVRPITQPGEVHRTNISRFLNLENGTRIETRSKYEYSYDGVHWFWPTRVRYYDSQTVKYKFGPRKWVNFQENFIYFGNKTNLTYEDLGNGSASFRFHQNSSFPRPSPANNVQIFHPSIEHHYNHTLTHKKQIYEYGPPLGRNTRQDPRFSRQYYSDYRDVYRPNRDPRWGPPLPPLPHRPPQPPPPPPPDHGRFPYPRYERREPYPEVRRDRPRDDPYYDGRHRSDDRYNDRRYFSGESRPEGRRNYDDAYHERKYDRRYDDRRYRPEGGGNADTRYDRRYNSERRRYDEYDYNSRRDRPAYGESPRFSNGSGEYYDGMSYGDTRRRYADSERRILEHGDSFEVYKWKFVYLDRNKIPEDRRRQEKYFLKEYRDILEKASKHIWKSHRDIRTVLPDFEELREAGVINNTYVIPIVNGSMALLNNLANKIEALIDKNLTLDDMDEPIIDRKIYGRSINNFDKMSEIFRQCRDTKEPNKKLEDLINKVFDQKKYLYITYGDITHMVSVLRRTLKRYGPSESLGTNRTETSTANRTETSSAENKTVTLSTTSGTETSSAENEADAVSTTTNGIETPSTANSTET